LQRDSYRQQFALNNGPVIPNPKMQQPPHVAAHHHSPPSQSSQTAASQPDHTLADVFHIAEPSSPVAAFFLAPHKTASVFVNELLHSITMATNRCWYRIAQQSRSGVCADYSR
jgi:hypothetical protein